VTTIAYRDGVLASDTIMSIGGCLLGETVKIWRSKNGDLAGVCGTAAYLHAFRDWFLKGQKGAPPEAKVDDDCMDRGVIFRKDGRIEVYEEGGMFEVTAPYYAAGSGRAEACGALFAGADAEMAVRAAIEHDPHTGGKVIVLRHD